MGSNWRINKYTSFIVLVLIFSLTSIMQTLIPFNINQLVGGLIFLNVIWIYSSFLKKSKFFFGVFVFSLIIGIFSFISCNNVLIQFTQTIYWLIAIWILSLLKSLLFKRKLINQMEGLSTLINYFILIDNIILIYSLLNNKCYSEWMGVYSFHGFTNHPHTIASGCCLVMVLCLVGTVLNNNEKYIFGVIKMLPAMIGILQTGARTFLIPMIIIFIILIIYCNKQISLKVLSIPITILISYYLFQNSSTIEKILQLANTNNNSITSGRSSFWLSDLKAYANLNVFNKLFGNGFDFVIKVNTNVANNAIGAHNDFITCLLGVGLLGTILYIVVLFQSIKTLAKKGYKFGTLLIMAYCVAPAFINGFYGYQQLFFSYTYLIIVMSFLFPLYSKRSAS